VSQAILDIPPAFNTLTVVAVIVAGQLVTNAKIDETNTKVDETNTKVDLNFIETKAMITNANDMNEKTKKALEVLTIRFDVIGYLIATLVALASAGSSIVKVLEYLKINP
jgi:outer membrane murein-binding lipoprotein Lpp